MRPTEPAPPLEFQYYSQEGHTRYYRDGAIWQLKNNTWIHIGYGLYLNNVVIEGNINSSSYQAQTRGLEQTYQTSSLPDLRPLRNFQYNISRYEADMYFPNVNGNLLSQVHRLQIGSHNIQIAIPKNSGYENAADGIIRTIAELPLKRIEALSTVRVNTSGNKDDYKWQQLYRNFTQSAATGGNGQMDIYPVSISNFMYANSAALRTTRHEFGHVIASQIFGSVMPNDIYSNNASRDRTTVSEYGNNSWAEDFAEGIELYLRTNAGQLSSNTRSLMTNRSSFFDDVFSYRTPQSVQSGPSHKRRIELYIKMISETEILAVAPEVGLGILIKID